MRFILPKMGKDNTEDNCIRVDEYARRTELITKMFLAGWLNEREIREYIDGIIANVEVFDENGAIFWSVDVPNTMPREARIDWAYEPTYNIVAFLIKAYWKYPNMLEELPGFKEALKGGMLASTYADFKGNHSDDVNYSRNVFELFQNAGADQFCSPGFQENLCPEFTKLFFAYSEYFYKLDAAAACGESKL